MVKKGIVSFVALGLLFLGLSRLLGLGEGGIETVTSYLTYPFLVVQKVLVGPFISWRNQRRILKNLTTEFENLCKQRDKLAKEVVELKALVHHIQMTQDMRTFLKRYDTDKAIIAPILLKNFKGSHFFLLDVGEQDGVQPGMIAVHNSCLIGKVTHVYPYYCRVLLITDPSCNVAAFCTSCAGEVKGIHVGQKIGNPRLDYVDHRDEVKLGDLVISSGKGGFFPRGFTLGRVALLENEGYSRSISVEPLVDLEHLDYCCLVSNRIHLTQQKEAQ